MNVGPVEAEGEYAPYREEEKIGKSLFWASSLIGAIAAFSPKKKRMYTVMSSTTGIDLPCPECNAEETSKIHTTFRILAQAENTLTLAFNAWTLLTLKSQILHVHPFSLFLVMPPEIMRAIFRNRVAIDGTLEGVRVGFEETANGHVSCFLSSFASKMNKDKEQIREYLAESNWDGLVRYLFGIQPD